MPLVDYGEMKRYFLSRHLRNVLMFTSSYSLYSLNHYLPVNFEITISVRLHILKNDFTHFYFNLISIENRIIISDMECLINFYLVVYILMRQYFPLHDFLFKYVQSTSSIYIYALEFRSFKYKNLNIDAPSMHLIVTKVIQGLHRRFLEKVLTFFVSLHSFFVLLTVVKP